MAKHVKVWKQAVSGILSLQPVPRDSRVRNLLLVLQYMYEVSVLAERHTFLFVSSSCNHGNTCFKANSGIAEPQRVPDSGFFLQIDLDLLQEDLWLWRSRPQRKVAKQSVGGETQTSDYIHVVTNCLLPAGGRRAAHPV